MNEIDAIKQDFINKIITTKTTNGGADGKAVCPQFAIANNMPTGIAFFSPLKQTKLTF